MALVAGEVFYSLQSSFGNLADKVFQIKSSKEKMYSLNYFFLLEEI